MKSLLSIAGFDYDVPGTFQELTQKGMDPCFAVADPNARRDGCAGPSVAMDSHSQRASNSVCKDSPNRLFSDLFEVLPKVLGFLFAQH